MRGNTHVFCLAVSLGLLVSAVSVARADAVSHQKSAQNKLLAQRAARVDAMRKLAERINGLQITSETSVRDFVAENDEIRTSMTAFLSGAREVGEPAHLPDGTCEVTLEITLQELVTHLKRVQKQFYRGDRVTTRDIEEMTTTIEEKTFRETGSGAPREEFADRGTSVPGTVTGAGIMSDAAWAYWNAHCTGRGRLMAVRAAEVDALRRLGERINGLFITSETRVRDFVAESDEIRTQMNAFLRGARTSRVTYHENELIVEVEKEVTLEELIANLRRWQQQSNQGNRVTVRNIEELTVTIEQKNISETGMGVPPEKYLKDLGPAGTAAVTFAEQAQQWPPTLQATGNAAVDDSGVAAAQAKLMALRAAELDARRKLAEQIDGLRISSNTTVRDFVAENDEIRTSLLTWQQGVRRVPNSEKVLPDGVAEVVVELETEPLWNIVLYWQQRVVN